MKCADRERRRSLDSEWVYLMWSSSPVFLNAPSALYLIGWLILSAEVSPSVTRSLGCFSRAELPHPSSTSFLLKLKAGSCLAIQRSLPAASSPSLVSLYYFPLPLCQEGVHKNRRVPYSGGHDFLLNVVQYYFINSLNLCQRDFPSSGASSLSSCFSFSNSSSIKGLLFSISFSA